jgi:Tol biopolymer transport system component
MKSSELGKPFFAIAFCATLILGTAVIALPIQPARAAFRGANGKIAFVSNRDGNDEIYSVNPDGKGQTRLTYNTYEDENPAWSPDGSKIAFERFIDSQWQIYVMNADGTEQRPLTSGASPHPWNHFAWHASWSPDGSKIVLESDRDHPNGEIYVMNSADGSGVTRLTYNTNFDGDPAWSPDGSKIAFASDRDGNYEIYVMKADGTGQTRLTTNAASDRRPAWSPDGSKLAFDSERDGGDNIYIMNADGAEVHAMTSKMNADAHAAWSPDGLRIAFTSFRDRNGEIYVMNAADGLDQKGLTYSTASDTNPDWQPIVAGPTSTITTAAATVGATSVVSTGGPPATVTTTALPPPSATSATEMISYLVWIPVLVSVAILIVALIVFNRGKRYFQKETVDRAKYANLLAQLDRLHERGEINETLYLRLREEYAKRI